MAKYPYIKAKKNSYGSKRDRNNVRFMVIHYTGNSNDLAISNARYFAETNTRMAGAHFFVDRKGNVVKSVAMNLIAWSVGGLYGKREGGGAYYKKCTNANSVSIELCDVAKRYPSDEQVKAVRKLIKHIRKYCPNAKTIIRHFDVNYKLCPARMCGKNNAEWNKFLNAIK